MSFTCFITLLLIVVANSQNTTCDPYDVSVASNKISNYGEANFPFVSMLDPFLNSVPPRLQQTLHWSISNVIVLVIIGIIMLIISIVLISLQCCCKVFSSPDERYWIWSIRATKAAVVIASFMIALFASVGLFHTYQLNAILPDPIIAVEQVIAEKYSLTQDVLYTINTTAQQYGITIPPELQQSLTYISELGSYHEAVVEFEATLIQYTSYAGLILTVGFGMIICSCVLAILFALHNQVFIPTMTIIFMVLCLLLLWSFASITGVISMVASRECNLGIDGFTQNYIQNSNLSPCVNEAMNHYLFCSNWSSVACPDPFVSIDSTLQGLLNYPLPQNLRDELIYLLQSLSGIQSCQDTTQVYNSAKQILCWDVTNSAIQITWLYILQSPILLTLLAFVLFGWFRFNLRQIPYSAYDNRPYLKQNAHLVMHQEELQPLTQENLHHSSIDNYEEFDKTSGYKHMARSLIKQSHHVLSKNIRTVVFVVVLFVVIFVSLTAWAIMQMDFSVYAKLC